MRIHIFLIFLLLSDILLPVCVSADIGTPPPRVIWYKPYAEKKEIDIKFTAFIGLNPFEDYGKGSFGVKINVPGPCLYSYNLYKKNRDGIYELIKSDMKDYNDFGCQDISLGYIDLAILDRNNKSYFKLSGEVTYYKYEKTKKQKENMYGKLKNDNIEIKINNEITIGYSGIFGGISRDIVVGDPDYDYILLDKNGENSKFCFEFDVTPVGNDNKSLTVYNITIMCNGKEYDIINTHDGGSVIMPIKISPEIIGAKIGSVTNE